MTHLPLLEVPDLLVHDLHELPHGARGLAVGRVLGRDGARLDRLLHLAVGVVAVAAAAAASAVDRDVVCCRFRERRHRSCCARRCLARRW